MRLRNRTSDILRKIFGCHVILSAGLSLCLLSAGGASAVSVTFDELPNEAGIHAYGDNGVGGGFDVTKLGAESFHLSSLVIPSGYPADATMSHIGISRTGPPGGYLVNILESAAGDLSDQVWVHVLNGVFTVMDFISDPDQFVTGVVPSATVLETGELQNVFNYSNDQGETVSLYVRSDLDVPEPASLSLIGMGLVCLVAGTSRRRRQQRAAG